MTSDTFATKFLGTVFRGPGQKDVSKACEIGEAGLYAGYTIRKSSGKLYLCKSGEQFAGILDRTIGDFDTAFDSGDEAEYFEAGSKQIVICYYVAQSPAVNLEGGEPMYLSTTDGMIKKGAYSDGTEATDFPTEYVGRFCGDAVVTGSTSNNQLIDVRLG